MNMNLSELINEIVSDWAYRVNDGMPNPKNPMHVKELENVLSEMGLGHIKSELLQRLNEAEAGGFSNPALNKKVRYKSASGEDKEGIVGNLLRQPEDSPGRKAAEATLPPEGSPERETMNQELGAEKDGKAKPPEDAKGKEGEDGKEGGADAEAEKKKKTAAMFDPKADPAMGARLDREKAASEKLAQKDTEDSEAKKAPTPGSPEDFKDKADKVAKEKEEAKKKGYDDSLHAMSDNQLDAAIVNAEKKMHDAQKSGDDKAADKANTEYAQHKVEQEMRKASKGGDKEIADAAVGNFLARKKDYEEKYGEPYEADIPYPDSDGGERTSAKWGDEEPKGTEAGPNEEPPMDEPSKPDTTPPADAEEPKDGEEPPAPAALGDTPEETPEEKKIDKTAAAADKLLDKAEKDIEDIELLKQLRDEEPELFDNMGIDWDKTDPEILAQIKDRKDTKEKLKQNAKKEKTKKKTKKAASELKNRKTTDGEELDVDTTPNGSLIIGVEHGNELESTKQTIEKIQKLPKDTKVMFVGEGGMSKDADGNIQFGGEQDEIRNSVKGHFDNAEESSWDENANIEDDQSQVYKEIEKELGSPSKSRAAIWTNMVGQGDNLKPEDYLDDEGKQWIIDQAKKAGATNITDKTDFNNLTDAERKDLYELNYNDEGKMGDNEIMKGQKAYNDFRQKELDRKIKEAEDAGYTVIAPVGNSHVDMRRQRMKSQQKPEQQPTDTKPEDKPEDKPKEEPAKPTETPKATKDDIKKEKPGKEAKTDSGGSLYSIGGGYYSDKPNGPAKYVRTESVIEMAFDNNLNEDVFALFEKSITGTLQNGEKITVQELPPRAVKKATQRAKAAAASSKEEPAQPTSTQTPAEQPKGGSFNPISADDVKTQMPKANTDTFGSKPDIPDEIDPKDLEKFNTDIAKVGKQISDAKERGEKAPNINLCDVTVPGTNLYCDDNLGIPRDQMPQFKGKPQPGTPAADMPLDKNGEVDTEPLFKKMLEEKGIKVVQTEVASDKLKATQSELVADKVIGMMNTLENDPTNESLTAPIYVSRDGYVIDGHHRWAAITAYNAKHPDNQIPMKVQAIDMDAKDAIPMCNKFAEEQGVAAKKADANNENPTTRDAVPTDKEANEQIAKEKEGLSHEENQAYEFLDGLSDEEKAEAIDKALNDRTIIQKAMQDTMVGNWFMKKGKMLKNVYKAVEQKYKTGRSGTTKDCSDAPPGPHANKNETIKEAPQNRQDYLASLDKTGKKKKKGDDSECKDVHIEDYQKRDEKGKPKYKTVPVYESGEKPDPADFGPDGSYYTGLINGYIGPRERGKAVGTTKENAFKASELDSKTGYFKRDGKYYDKDGEEINEKGQKLDAQGNTTQKTERCWLCWPPGKEVPSMQEVADLEDDLTPEQKHVAHHAEHVEHERKHAAKHLAIEASLIIGGAMAGPWLLAKAGLGGAAAGTQTVAHAGTHVATAAAEHHGAAALAAHIAKDFGKHALAETLGVTNPYGAAGAGLAASALTGGVLESFWKQIEGYDLLLEGVGDKNDELASKDFFEKLCRLGLEKMKTYKMTPQQKLESIRSYKFEKAQKEKEKEKKDKLKDLASLLKEKTSNSKQNSINHFVEFASKRLNLKETPKVNLMSGNEFKNELAALGGYDPSSKEIFVATDGRLTADILRTIAHEMVHKKQAEKGFLKNIDKDGSAGSKIENQANAIAGILMREYGKMNKQIYNENTKKMKIESLVREIISEIKLEAKGETFTAIKKDTGMTSVFKSKEARDSAVKAGTHKMTKADKEAPKKVAGSDMDYRQTPDMKKAQPEPSQKVKEVPSEDENPAGQYDEKDKYQKAVVSAKNDNEMYSALDTMGDEEARLMYDEVKAGAGGPVASTGETMCTEAQTDLIQGRYNQKEQRNSDKYKAIHKNLINAYKGTDKKRIKTIQKELDNICDKLGYYDANGNPDYDAAIAMMAEAELYTANNMPAFKKTKVSKEKFKKDEDRTAWMKTSFYSSYSLLNNGPDDWDRKKGNGRVMKANSRTDGAVKKVLDDKLAKAIASKDKKAIAHYQNEIKSWEKFKGYHDTYMVYTNKDGYTSTYHISNKKSDELDDPQNNTTPDKRLNTFSEAAKQANLPPKSALRVGKAQVVAMQGAADIDNVAKSAYSDIDENGLKLMASLSNRLPARSESDVKGEYLTDLKNDKLIKKALGDKYDKATPEQIVAAAMKIVNDPNTDISKLSGNFTKFIIKQGQLAQSIFSKAQSGMNAAAISAKMRGIYTEKEIKAILGSPLMKKLSEVKAQHAAGLAGVHQGFIEELHKADGTKIGDNKPNGPAVETYVRGTLKALHIDTYVTNFDGKVQIEMGGVGCTPVDVRGCMASLSGFKGDINSEKGRAALVDHLSKNVKVDSDSDAVYLVGDNGQRTYIASDTWRQAGSSKKIATGFGSNLRKCLKKSVSSRLSNRKSKK